LNAQVTTAALNGIVLDKGGEPLIGATIVATHVPSGTQYGTTTLVNGRFNLANMRVGGPYKIEATYVGFENQTFDDVFLSLGQKLALDINMAETAVELEGIVVTAKENAVINSDRTGPNTSINAQQLRDLPTISRSAEDYTRLNPMASDGGSFAGRNDQFNNFSLDGTIFNNPFGLDAATPGGQTKAQPVSLDALDQINVAIAPYDVTQSGFTGAAVNAVTKSGTNEFKGSIFGFFRNADMTGGKVDGVDIFKGDLKQLQAGFSVGGPIVKNKVFFFANFELENRSDLGSFFVPNSGSTGANVSRVLLSDMQMVSDLLKSKYNYETGAAQDFIYDSDNRKGLFKLDFNLNKNHTLTASYNFLTAFRDQPAHPSAIGRRGPDFQTLQFENTGYRINNKIHSGIAELKSIFGSRISNKLQVGYTAFRDHRDPFSTPFPMVNIGKDGVRYIIAGHEPFSINNVLSQDVFQLKNDLTLFSGKHTWTFGTAFERFNFDNSFNLGVYGGRVFAPDVDINDFPDFINSGGLDEAVSAAKATFENNNANDTWALAETNVGQWSIYGQDEIAVNQKLNITLGLRVDVPLYFNTSDKIRENLERNCCYMPEIVYFDEEGNSVTFDQTVLPDSKPLINPRFGFNYDIKGDGTSQLRGGTGLFSGRFPFVWVGNQVANPNFFFYNMTASDFKFPQVWRTNIGHDRQFGNGWVATVDLLYTKDVQSHIVRNYGLKPPTGTLSGVDNRPIYTLNDRALVFGGPTNAYVFTNAQSGYSFNASFQLEKTWKNSYFKMGYNYLKAEDVASLDAEISGDAYDRNPANIQHTNTPELAPSLYGNRHRIFGVVSKRFPWSNGKNTTTVSLFIEYLEGGRYSYTYSGDLNNDGSGLNDLLYIPTDSEIDQMNFGDNGSAQKGALKSYIAQDEYLSGRRGEYAEKYGAISPWFSTADLRILQDISVSGDNKFQISLDILNVGNLINSSWGVRQFATQTSLAQPIGVSVADGVPTYSFDTAQKQTFFNDFSLESRWQIQLGLRYSF
jgi:hypothetical protein